MPTTRSSSTSSNGRLAVSAQMEPAGAIIDVRPAHDERETLVIHVKPEDVFPAENLDSERDSGTDMTEGGDDADQSDQSGEESVYFTDSDSAPSSQGTLNRAFTSDQEPQLTTSEDETDCDNQELVIDGAVPDTNEYIEESMEEGNETTDEEPEYLGRI